MFSIIEKHKSVIENKKTDAVHNSQKARAWTAVATEFNAIGFNRDEGQLKKFYNNQKKLLRKRVAEERIQILTTGK